MVVAISDDQARSSLGEFWEHGKLVGIGRGYRDAADHPRPANPYVHPKAVEGLPEKRVLGEGCFSFEAAAAVGAGKQASRQGQRVHQREGRIVGSEGEELLPEGRSFTFQRLAAWRAKVVRWTSLRVGNHSA
jgi:hypothetical protein